MQLREPTGWYEDSFLDLFNFIKSMFLGKEELREGKNQTLWSPNFKYAMPSRDKKHHNKGTARYTSTKELWGLT